MNCQVMMHVLQECPMIAKTRRKAADKRAIFGSCADG